MKEKITILEKFLKIGFSVNKLVRIQYGPYRIGSLKTGEVKFLNINKVKFGICDNFYSSL